MATINDFKEFSQEVVVCESVSSYNAFQFQAEDKVMSFLQDYKLAGMTLGEVPVPFRGRQLY